MKEMFKAAPLYLRATYKLARLVRRGRQKVIKRLMRGSPSAIVPGKTSTLKAMSFFVTKASSDGLIAVGSGVFGATGGRAARKIITKSGQYASYAKEKAVMAMRNAQAIAMNVWADPTGRKLLISGATVLVGSGGWLVARRGVSAGAQLLGIKDQAVLEEAVISDLAAIDPNTFNALLSRGGETQGYALQLLDMVSEALFLLPASEAPELVAYRPLLENGDPDTKTGWGPTLDAERLIDEEIESDFGVVISGALAMVREALSGKDADPGFVETMESLIVADAQVVVSGGAEYEGEVVAVQQIRAQALRGEFLLQMSSMLITTGMAASMLGAARYADMIDAVLAEAAEDFTAHWRTNFVDSTIAFDVISEGIQFNNIFAPVLNALREE